MCWCNSALRTPFCGKPGCRAPNLGMETGDRPPVMGQAVPATGDLAVRPHMTGFAALAAVSGLSAAACEQLAHEVKANHALLEHCRNHSFTEPLDDPGSRLRVRWRCANCQGVVDASAKLWYARGRAHGHAHGDLR